MEGKPDWAQDGETHRLGGRPTARPSSWPPEEEYGIMGVCMCVFVDHTSRILLSYKIYSHIYIDLGLYKPLS